MADTKVVDSKPEHKLTDLAFEITSEPSGPAFDACLEITAHLGHSGGARRAAAELLEESHAEVTEDSVDRVCHLMARAGLALTLRAALAQILPIAS